MALTAAIGEDDWTVPASKGDLILVRADLKMVQADLEGKIKDVEVEVAEMGRSLGAEISRLRVSMAWTTVGVATVLGVFISLFEFLS